MLKDQVPQGVASTVFSKRNAVVFSAIFLVGLVADLLTKSWAFAWRGRPAPGQSNIWWLIEGYVGVETVENHGALFGMGQGKVGLFAILSIVAAIGVLYWAFFAGGLKDIWLSATLGGILAGILGNLYDRLGLWSDDGTKAVRDWIALKIGEVEANGRFVGYEWPNFNIADSLLVVGAFLFVVYSFKNPESTSAESSES